MSDRGEGVRGSGVAAQQGRRQGEGTAIMKLTTMTQVTLDGVMQGLEGRNGPGLSPGGAAAVRHRLKRVT